MLFFLDEPTPVAAIIRPKGNFYLSLNFRSKNLKVTICNTNYLKYHRDFFRNIDFMQFKNSYRDIFVFTFFFFSVFKIIFKFYLKPK